MKTETEKAIKALTERAGDKEVSAVDALQLSQAALNLAHVAQCAKDAEAKEGKE